MGFDGIGIFARGRLEYEEQDGYDSSADREVDIETPPPRDICGEHPSDQGARYRGDTEDGTENTLVEGSLVEGNGDYHYDDTAAENACGAESCYCATDNEGSRAWGSTANC